MILAVDVDYRETVASVSGICFNDWSDADATQICHSVVSGVEAYEPGRFYRREMPCILQLLREHNLTPDIIVIDGYVSLGDASAAGLGMHLFNALDRKIPVIGVAKKPFRGTSADTGILRGNSAKPLYVTAVGISPDQAKRNVLAMHGPHRLPTLLKAVDRACRNG